MTTKTNEIAMNEPQEPRRLTLWTLVLTSIGLFMVATWVGALVVAGGALAALAIPRRARASEDVAATPALEAC